MSDNDIDALLAFLGRMAMPKQHAALTALVAERNALKQERQMYWESCDALEKQTIDLKARVAAQDADIKALAASNAILHGRIEAHPPADRDRELRERLVCAALAGLMAYPGPSSHRNCEEWAHASVRQADATLAAMRKGEQDGK